MKTDQTAIGPTRIWFLVLIGLGLATGLFVVASEVQAAQTLPPPPAAVTMSNAECLDCHAQEGLAYVFPDGSQIALTVDAVLFGTSAHGRMGYSCIQCHTDISGYPHPVMQAQSSREYIVSANMVCETCHVSEGEEYHQGRHSALIAEGNLESATCSDCHGSHNLHEFGAERTKIAAACERCHSEIYNLYRQSVHGAGLVDEFNVDVPSCIDCHENHANKGPADQGFTLFSPQICAQCHADVELMGSYGVNTEVFETYLSDFHGTTVEIFERISPDQETNKPVCIDCHGVHDIRRVDDVGSAVIKQNLLDTCQRCHTGATPNFSDAWLSHYPPDLNHNRLVYLVDLFYMLFIPGTVGGMVLFIASDIWRRRRQVGTGD